MEKKVKDFIEEITDKFSELYVETFLIRYLSDYKEHDLIETLKNANTKLKTKIKIRITDALEEMGFDKKDIDI